MKKFVFLYVGFEEYTKDGMSAWMNWFATFKNNIVDSGNPFEGGVEITEGGRESLPRDRQCISGYSIVNAKDQAEAEGFTKGCPAVGGVRVYEAIPM